MVLRCLSDVFIREARKPVRMSKIMQILCLIGDNGDARGEAISDSPSLDRAWQGLENSGHIGGEGERTNCRRVVQPYTRTVNPRDTGRRR